VLAHVCLWPLAHLNTLCSSFLLVWYRDRFLSPFPIHCTTSRRRRRADHTCLTLICELAFSCRPTCVRRLLRVPASSCPSCLPPPSRPPMPPVPSCSPSRPLPLATASSRRPCRPTPCSLSLRWPTPSPPLPLILLYHRPPASCVLPPVSIAYVKPPLASSHLKERQGCCLT
jgi:hypothetical protein